MKRFFTYSTVATVVVVLIAGVFLLNRLTQFRAEIAQLKTDGFPVSIADLTIDTAEGEVDAGVQYRRLLEPLASFEKEMFEDEKALSLTRKPDELIANRFDELNEAYPTVFPLITEVANADVVSLKSGDADSKAGERGMGMEPLAEHVTDNDFLQFQQVRSCARVLQFKSRALLAKGKPDEALESVMETFKLCQTFRSYPTLVSQLVRHALRGIAIAGAYDIVANYELKTESLAALNELLEEADGSDEYLTTLIGERAWGCSTISDMGTIQLAFSGKGYLELLASEIEQSDKDWFASDFSFEKDLTWMDGWAGPMLLPALQQLRNANARVTSQVRGLRIVSALAANPDSIGKEISKDYLIGIGVPESMMVDPMDGKSLRVKRVGDHWIAYSIGMNLVDDGGMQKGWNDFVVGPAEEE